MEVWGDLRQGRSSLTSSVVTLGNFDGLHVGHQALISHCTALAKKQGTPSVLVTFDPPPSKVLCPNEPTPQLFDREYLKTHLAQLGIEILVLQPFDKELAQLSPQAFVKDLIWCPLSPSHMVIGYDYRFGAKRKGSAQDLKQLGLELGFEAWVVSPVKIEDQVVSSSRIRQALMEGDVKLAQMLLGRHYFLCGSIVSGAGRGKVLGFPTLNIKTSAEVIPGSGVYVTRFHEGEHSYNAVSNLGWNPTFDERAGSGPMKIETHLIGVNEFSSSSEVVGLEFLGRLRSEKKFANKDDLIKTIHQDIEEAKVFFSKEP